MALPTLTVLTLRNRARRESGVNATDYADTSVLEDLNQAYIKLAGLLANLDEGYFEEQNDKFDLVANSSLYSLPTDFLALRQLRLAYSGTPASPADYKISTAYDPTDVHLVSSDEENIPTANPIHNLTASYIRIKPTPTRAVTHGGRIWYIALPSALANTGDVPNLPMAYQELLATYAAKEMTFRYQKWNKHDRLEKKWDTAIGELMQTLADRDRNKPRRMKSPLEVGAQSHVRRELPNR